MGLLLLFLNELGHYFKNSVLILIWQLSIDTIYKKKSFLGSSVIFKMVKRYWDQKKKKKVGNYCSTIMEMNKLQAMTWINWKNIVWSKISQTEEYVILFIKQ